MVLGIAWFLFGWFAGLGQVQFPWGSADLQNQLLCAILKKKYQESEENIIPRKISIFIMLNVLDLLVQTDMTRTLYASETKQRRTNS